MGNLTDITGKKFGRWLVLGRSVEGRVDNSWKCLCSCGTERVVSGYSLIEGSSKSCGCLSRDSSSKRMTTHGMSSSRFYKIWTWMIQRCSNEKCERYPIYGGRGIEVCERWKSFENFRDDMYSSYVIHVDKFGEPDTTLERVDVNGNYNPQNCCWATKIEQSRNKRPNETESGVRGVHKRKDTGRWRAYITVNKKRLNLGTFDNEADAVAAREAAEVQYWGGSKRGMR